MDSSVKTTCDKLYADVIILHLLNQNKNYSSNITSERKRELSQGQSHVTCIKNQYFTYTLLYSVAIFSSLFTYIKSTKWLSRESNPAVNFAGTQMLITSEMQKAKKQ